MENGRGKMDDVVGYWPFPSSIFHITSHLHLPLVKLQTDY